MKKGTIVKNMWQSNHESLLVYMGTNGKYTDMLWLLDGKFRGKHQFYKHDILEDRENFPIVGYVNYEKVMVDAIRNGLTEAEQEKQKCPK